MFVTPPTGVNALAARLSSMTAPTADKPVLERNHA